MKKRQILTTSIFMSIGLTAMGANSAQADVQQVSSKSVSQQNSAKPNFFPPTDGGSSSPTPNIPGASSVGMQVCYSVRVVAGFTTVWMIVGNVSKPVLVAVYGSEWICTIVYG